MGTHFVILAAGRGTRLGGDLPKPLTVLEDGRSILQQQLDNLTEVFGVDALARTIVVVGHRADEIRAALPAAVRTVFNPDYENTNTSKSLALGLSAVRPSNGALWLNGDVVFDPQILQETVDLIRAKSSFAVVNRGETSEEEVKYEIDGQGFLSRISKTVHPGLGEAVGINYVSAYDLVHFLNALQEVRAGDYFEAAMGLTIRRGAAWKTLCIRDSYAVEVDFPEDLVRANDAQGSATIVA